MNGVLGVLTVNDRLGSNRGFDMGDLRLLETVATELATALEREDDALLLSLADAERARDKARDATSDDQFAYAQRASS